MLPTLPTPLRAARRRFQFLAQAMLIVFVVGWIAWFYPFDDWLDRRGTPLGADFTMFYVGGQLAAEGRLDRLYDQAYQQQRLHQLFPQLDDRFCLPYRYPPFVALAFAPLTSLSYPAAFLVFFCLSLAAWGAAMWGLALQGSPHTPAPRGTLTWILLGWPVALETLIGGQASMLAALIAVGTLMLLQRQRPLAAGMLLALAAYKPNVLGLFAVGLVVRWPRMLIGIALAGSLGAGICYWSGAVPACGDYLALVSRLTSGSWDVDTPFWKVQGLASWFALLVPGRGRGISIVVGCVAAAAVGWWWRKRHHGGCTGLDALAPCLLLVVNTLCNPYAPIYDLVLLGLAGWLGVEALLRVVGEEAAISGWPPPASATEQPNASRNPAGESSSLLANLSGQMSMAYASFALLFLGPHLSQALARPLGLQLFPAAMLLLVAWYCACWRRRFRVEAVERRT